MRVLQLIPTLVVGGAEHMVAHLAGHLHRWGHSIEVVSMYDPFGSWIEAGLRSEGVPVRFLGKRRGFDARMVLRIAREITAFRPDVLHTHMYSLKYALPGLALWRQCRVVHTLHTVAKQEAGRLSQMINHVAFRAGVVPIAVGEGVAESMRSLYGVSPRQVIANGIPVSDYAPRAGARLELRAPLAIPDEAPVFVTVAQFVPAKHHELLIDAFASKRLRSLQAHLLLAGDGARRRELEQRAYALGAGDRVHFLGVRSDVPRVLAAGDVFVLSSSREGNPLSVMEAMAAGKPVVATAVGCLPELVSGATGQLVPPGEPVALEAAMYELARDLALARAKGTAAARVARERFDVVVMARAYERLYAELTMSGASARRRPTSSESAG